MDPYSDLGIALLPHITKVFWPYGAKQALAEASGCDPADVSNVLRSRPRSMHHFPKMMDVLIKGDAFETTDQAYAVAKKAYGAIKKRRDAEQIKANLEAVIDTIDAHPKPKRKVEEEPPSEEVREQMQRIARLSDEFAGHVAYWRSKGWIPPE